MNLPQTTTKQFKDLSGRLLKLDDYVTYMVDLLACEIRYGKISKIEGSVIQILGVDNDTVCMHLLNHPRPEQIAWLEELPEEVQLTLDMFVITKE